MTLRQRVRFYQQLAVLARAGVPLRASLTRLRERLTGRELETLAQKVNAGEKIGDAFIAAGFSPFEYHLVAAGERSAQLEVVFQHLSEFWKRQIEMREAILRPLYYPFAVLHLAILVGSLVELASLSAMTVALHFFGRLAALYLVLGLLYLAVRLSWKSEAAQRCWLFLPLIGSTLGAAHAYRWITALRLEHGAGIPMPDAVADAWRASGFVGCERLAREGEAALREGTELSKLLLHWRLLPRDWIDFVETGEVSGALETAFKNLEDEAARAWSLAQQRLTDWMPKIIYFFILLITAAQVAVILYHAIVTPMVDAESAIDQALH